MWIMLRITAVSAGAVDYLLRGSGCEHGQAQQHAPERGQEPAVQADAAGYFLSATEHGEAPGRWLGGGLDAVGMQAGTMATEDDIRSIFGELKHPETGDNLGRAPYSYKGYTERLDAALAAEPDATPERREQIELGVKMANSKAVAYYDFTFSPVKSVSVYYAALLATGETEQAAQVLAAHGRAVELALGYTEEHGAYTRTGYHGKTVGGRSVGRYEAADGLIVAAFPHSTNRKNEPQIHTHAAVLNRVRTSSDGKMRALDGKGFRPIKEAIATAYERALEQILTDTMGVKFGLRPDGKAREILGVDPQLCGEASSRRAQVVERRDELVAEYRERHGQEPSAATLKKLAQQATLETRDAKSSEAGPGAVKEWGEARIEKMHATVESVAEAAAEVERTGHPDFRALPDRNDREAILRSAIAGVQAEYPTWTIGNLVAAVDKQVVNLPCSVEERPAYIEAMAREALAPGNPYGTLLLTAPDLVDVPTPLRRAEDGRSVFRPHVDELYTTDQHLSTERRLVVGARQQTAPAVAGPDLELLRVELGARGLNEDQAAAVLGVMSSGLAGDVLIGPAGTGKSYTVGTLKEVWSERFGGRVLGLATSQKATQELLGNGLEAVNTTVFLNQFTPNERGEVRDQVRAGDLFVVDEAGMSSTNELAQISTLVEAGGGKLLYTGDMHQLAAVQAGGMLQLLANDNGCYELKDVRRFADERLDGTKQIREWEATASLRLRAGDAAVIPEYEHRGRLHGGTVEEIQAAAVRGYVADTLEGLDSLLIVRTNEEARDLSREIREQFVEVGRVQREAVATLDNGCQVGVGDVIQAGKNDYGIQVDGPGMVTNRMMYTVRGMDERGRLVAEDANGAVAHLPMSYVAENITLGYACTIHSAQGANVDTSHDLFDEKTMREDAYTALGRGRLRNTAYLRTEREPDEHEVERLNRTPAGMLGTILENTGADKAAELTYREGQEEARSLAWIGTQWDAVSKEYARDRYTDVLRRLVPATEMDALVAEPGYDRLMRSVREAELAGHNADAVLTEAVTARELGTADSVTDVLRYRVRVGTADRVPEQPVNAADWTTLAAPLDGTVGQFVHSMAVLASDRQAELGQRVATELPDWAVQHLGLPPDQAEQREEWVRRAGQAAAYRELRNVPTDQVSLGAAPSREQEFHRALWQQAHAALGSPADQLDYYAASNEELQAMRAQWEREQTWAPTYVADEMQTAYTLGAGFRQDAAVFAAQLATMEERSPEHTATLAEVERAQRMAEDYTERARQLEEVHTARGRWVETTADAQLRAQLAADELERRGVDLHPEPALVPEQLAFFEVAGEHEVGPDPERPAELGTEQDQARDVAEPVANVEPEPERPEIEAEPVEHVRWWQRWADRLTGRDQQPEPTEEAGAEASVQEQPDQADERLVREPVSTPANDMAPAVDRAMDENQLELFPAEPSVEDRVQAQPLRQADLEREKAEQDELRVTLAEARRQAQAAELLRQQREETAPERAERRREEAVAAEVEADRERRDQAEREADRTADTTREREPAAAVDRSEPVRERAVDTPQIELVQTPAQPEPNRPSGPDLG